ncbi:hypothetical protein RUM43_007105, partial [Polyplax serrata]
MSNNLVFTVSHFFLLSQNDPLKNLEKVSILGADGAFTGETLLLVMNTKTSYEIGFNLVSRNKRKTAQENKKKFNFSLGNPAGDIVPRRTR